MRRESDWPQFRDRIRNRAVHEGQMCVNGGCAEKDERRHYINQSKQSKNRANNQKQSAYWSMRSKNVVLSSTLWSFMIPGHGPNRINWIAN